MRKTLETVALVLLLLTWAITVYAIKGPHPLPGRIPTHFDAAGRPDGWGTPAMLWMLPGMATGIYLLMGLVARYPSSFNFPMRIRPAARRRFEGLALSMLSWLKAEVICLFAWVQYKTIELARSGEGRLSPLFLPVVLIAVFGTIAWHMAAMRRAARAQ
jgi:hypothetical protein